MDKFNDNFPKEPAQPHPNQGTDARRATEEVVTEHAFARQVHLTPIPLVTSTPACPYDSIPT